MSPTLLEHINPHVAGIDCGSAEHFVAVPPDRDPTAGPSVLDVHDGSARSWLTGSPRVGVTSVAMEATGVYWIPIYELLEARGFKVLLVNARHFKNVPGRKSDVSDCEWLRELHSVGLLRGSFRPTAGIVALRTYLRHRQTLVETASTFIQRMQKALVEMNLQLPLVVSDITGATGLRILRDIVAGQRDPDAPRPASRSPVPRDRGRDRRRADRPLSARLPVCLEQNLEAFDACQAQIAAVRHDDRRPPPTRSPPRSPLRRPRCRRRAAAGRPPKNNDLPFDVRPAAVSPDGRRRPDAD